MIPQLKRALVENHASYRGSITPWSACVRTVFCSHLRLIWHVFMVLTVLCVARQLLSVVRQSRNNKTRLSDKQLINPHQVVLQDVQSIREKFNANQAALHPFQWSDKKDKGLNKVPELARRLTSTANRILNPKLANKVDTSHDLKDELVVDGEIPKKTRLQEELPELQDPAHTQSTPQTSIFSASLQNGICQPKNHIVFLKTHKTASSTILNILYRYGDTRDLMFALPANMHSQLYYPNFFTAHFVEGVRTRRVTKFHIMCNHMRFRGSQVRKIMPVDTFYFSIVRNPVSMMESLFTYYKVIPAFRNFKTLQDFLLDNGRSYNASVPDSHYAQNILTFDFGFNNSAPGNDAELEERAVAIISAVESELHLVLISEYFDESVVLLRHALCWTLEDVMSFRLNSRSDKSRKPLSAEMIEQVKKWNALDWRLYQHFNTSFWRRIDTTLGRAKLQKEVELLRAKREELEKTCLLGGKAVDPGQVHDSSVKPFQYGQAVIQGYNLRQELDNDTHQLCRRLITPELQYTMALYKKQFPDLAAKMATVKKGPVSTKKVVNDVKNSTIHRA
ncbi:Galactose-3-O-sulfotransferase 2 [Bagarius yarrelli]|uniref:Galactose-3-O-sulfotransferase 2 n=1 Tax=Bagarius yarrelli TaxID=175774 RepID=A0A556TTX0_BAGYA|nr:Galactose-3-O-sulfotransferase 2 [Bagarius yarrelli]